MGVGIRGGEKWKEVSKEKKMYLFYLSFPRNRLMTKIHVQVADLMVNNLGGT